MTTDGVTAESAAHDAGPTDDRGARRGLVLVLVLSAVLGVVFALRIPHGLPYDEPSYWNVTRFYARFHRLPVLGHRGVTYEAQHPPLAFVFGALGHNLGAVFGSEGSAAFTATRLVGGIELLGAVVVLERILARTVASVTGRIVALLVFAATPMMLAMSWSVQNDSLSLLIGFASIELMLGAEGRDGPGLRARSGLLVGIVVGLGIVTKITLVFLVPAFVVWVALRAWPRHRRIMRTVAAFGVGVAAACGWWFVRNLVVYGHLIGDTRLGGGPTFTPAGFHGPSTVSTMAKEAITYLWLPTEYFRSLLHAPAGLQGLLGVTTVAILAAAVVLRLRDRTPGQAVVTPPAALTPSGSAWLLLALVGIVAVVGYEVLFVVVISFPARTAFIALPLWCSAIGYVVGRLVEHRSVAFRQGTVVAAVTVVVALDVWVLASVSSLGPVAHGFL